MFFNWSIKKSLKSLKNYLKAKIGQFKQNSLKKSHKYFKNQKHSVAMSPFLLLVILSLLIPSIPTAKKKEEFVKGRRFTALECRPENTSIAIHYCYIKAISRRVTTLNVGLTFIKPLKRQFNVQFVENYRYGNIYREVINTHKLDFCGLMGNSLSNPFVSSIMNEVKASAPQLFHKCPYEGEKIISSNFI